MKIIKICELPEWLQKGDMYKNFISNGDADCELLRPIKTDLTFKGLRDIMEFIDTCLYTGLEEFPYEVYDFACRYPLEILTEMNELEMKEGELFNAYYEFTNIPEYKAIRICCECYACSHCYDCDRSMKKYENMILLQNAIIHNNMPLVRYCVEYFGRCTIEILNLVIVHGHVEIFQYLLEKHPYWVSSVKWNYYYAMTAAENGKLNMLVYLHEELDVIWTEQTITLAFFGCHYDCVIYAITHGCPIPMQCMYYAIACNRSVEIINCILKDKYFHVENPELILNFAMRNGNLETVKLLYEYGYKPNEDTVRSAKTGKNKHSEELINFAIQISPFYINT